MKTPEPIMAGYLPGGEDRIQWVFEGDGWTTDETQSVIEALTAYVNEYRQRYEDDMVNYFKFSYFDGILQDGRRVYYITRRSWQFTEQAHGFDALLPKLTEIIQRAQRGQSFP
jgi:hypothetical protein